jgi:hypothetical protein
MLVLVEFFLQGCEQSSGLMSLHLELTTCLLILYGVQFPERS